MNLPTDLKHVSSGPELETLLKEKENLMVCCGRMGPMCIPVYGHMKKLVESGNFPQIEFRDMLFDNPDAAVIREHPKCRSFMGLPFTVYYKNGKMVHATSSLQSEEQIKEILNKYFT
ncbi:MAG: thioredoxin [Deltaproteobacteria bacterium]|jgi:thioredoxin 1|nr:thioredoxin [Deltaproteobacteria bacterium]